MKTKKLILRLLLASFFITAFAPKDAEAAGRQDTLTFVQGKGIYIGSDSVGYGSSPSDPNYTQAYADLNENGYIINPGTATTSGNNIVVNVPGTLDLTLTGQLNMRQGCQIDIQRGNVNITLVGQTDIIAPSNQPAIKVAAGASLTISARDRTGELVVSGGGNNMPTISGGSLAIKSGTVVLNKYGTGTAFTGTSFVVDGGTVTCYDGDKPDAQTLADIGDLIQNGGIIKADGFAEIDYQNEKLTKLKPGEKYKFSIGKDGATLEQTASANGEVDINENWYGKIIYINSRQRLDVPARPAAPKLTCNPTSMAGKADGKISGFNKDTMLISYDGENGSYRTHYDSVVSDLAAGDYWIKTMATDSSFASSPGKHTIEKGAIISVTVPTFNPVTFGYTELPNASNIIIHNYDENVVTINKVSVEANPSTSFVFRNLITSDTTLRNGEDNTTVSVQPSPNLHAGTYTARIRIFYSSATENINGDYIDKEIVFTVNKKDQPRPSGDLTVAPNNITFDSVKLNALPEGSAPVEYRIADGKWSDSPNFTKLDPETDYIFEARYKETDDYNASEVIASGKITTDPKAKIDYVTEELVLPQGRAYTITVDGKESDFTPTNGKIKIDKTWFGKKNIQILDHFNQSKQTLSLIPSVNKAPSSPKAVAETFASAHDGQITGTNDKMQFRKQRKTGEWPESWEACTGKSIDNLEPGVYQVRTAATASAFATESVTLVIEKGKVLTVTVNGDNQMVYGTAPVAQVIAVENHDQNNSVGIEGMSVDAETFTVSDGAKKIDAGDTIDSWKLQPKEKLNAGSYTANLIVTYDDTETDSSDDDPDDSNTDDDQNTDDNDEQGVQTQATEDNKDESNNETDKKPNTKEISVPVELTVTKAEQDAPPVPSEKSKTSTSITLETIPNSPVSGAAAQYSKDGGKTWQDSPTFTGLTANREYTFVARYAETDNYNASEVSAGEIAITTEPKDDSSNVSGNANDNNSNNGSNGNSSNGNSTNGTNGTNGTTGTNGTGTNGTGTSGSGTGTDSSGGTLTSAKTGDLNNVQLWVTLAVISYLSCMIIIRNRMKQSKA